MIDLLHKHEFEYQQHLLFSDLRSSVGGLMTMVWAAFGAKLEPAPAFSSAFFEPNVYISERIVRNADSTLVESSAEVSIKLNPLFSANEEPSSVLTALRCCKSHLFPTNMITILESA